MDLLISAHEPFVDAISDVIWRPLYLVPVILVVQSKVEVKVPLVVEVFSAHSRDKRRIVRGDDIDRVRVLEELFIEPVIEVIKIE